MSERQHGRKHDVDEADSAPEELQLTALYSVRTSKGTWVATYASAPQ